MAGVMVACLEGLARCLEAQPKLESHDRLSADARLPIYRTLYHAWESSRDYGVWDDTEEDVADLIARTSTPAERAQVEEWIRADLADSPKPSPLGDKERWDHASFDRRAKVDFLLAVKGAGKLTDEEVLAEYRSAGLHGRAAAFLRDKGRIEEALEEYRGAGLYQEMLGLLVEQGRVEEALRTAQRKLVSPRQVTAFAEGVLALDGWRDAALKFVEDRLWEEKAPRNTEEYLRWLEERYVKYGMPAEALKAAQSRFKAGPGRQTYESVKRAARMRGQPAGLWKEVRPGVIATLEARSAWNDLVYIYLDEKEVGKALDALDKEEEEARAKAIRTPQYTYGGYGGYQPSWGPGQQKLRVAEAAEKDYPERARAVYEQVAEGYIGYRGRESYKEAAKLLKKVRELYLKQSQEAEWLAYIADLRASNKSLRALKEELDLLGL
jgi:hypothetical protein